MNASDFLHLSESKVNATKAAEDFASWLHTERGVITLIEVLFVLSVVLHAVQVVFGWWRRCSSNTYLKYSLWLAYTINPILVIYTLGLARSSPPSAASKLLQACALPFVMALGSTNSMTAYSVDDNKQYMRHFVQQVLRVMSLFVMWRTNEPKLTNFSLFLAFIYLFLTVLMLSMNGGRIYASMTASSFLDRQSRNVQVHMRTEHTGSTYYNPVTMRGYNYLFWEDIVSDEDRTLVTVDRIWSSNEGPLGSSDGNHLKEVCLSFVLFRLLRRRFFGLACPESNLQKTGDLVLNGLLLDLGNYEAAYRVIEVELAFAHDHFFTSSASLNAKLGNVIILLSIAKVVIYPVTILSSIKDFFIHNYRNTSSGVVLTGGFDPILTALLIMIVLLALELLQIYLYLSSDWAKVRLVRRSIYHFSELQRRWSLWHIFGEDSCFGIYGLFIWLGIDGYFIKLPRVLGYWQNKIGQHALLKELHGRSYIADIVGSISGCFFAEYLDYHPVFSRGIFSPGTKGPRRVRLTGDVKLAIAQTLKTSRGRPSNGANSLKWNGQRRLLWACQLEHHTATMLIWHIATEYCDIAQYCCEREEEQDRSAPTRAIATTLSSYCMYLMAFVPELLPDEELDTRIIFQEVRCQAKKMLSRKRTLDDKYRAMRNFEMQPSDERIFIKGIRLGRKLEGMRDDMLWKILADFWTEMVLYVAPSDNAKAHIEHLAHGGEFLTHLWALLFHAGILEREE